MSGIGMVTAEAHIVNAEVNFLGAVGVLGIDLDGVLLAILFQPRRF